MFIRAKAAMLSLFLLLQIVPISTAQEWGPHNGNYILVDDYNPSNFFNKFTFNTVGVSSHHTIF
jgi:hypothetical protein